MSVEPRRGLSGPSVVHPFMPQSADALPVELQRLDRDHVLHRMGLHGHTFFELILIEEAGGAHRVGRDLHPAEAGALFVIAPGQLHDCSDLGGAATGWVLLFTHEALDGAAAASRAYAPHWPSHHPLLSPFLVLGRKDQPALRVPPADRTMWAERFRTMAHELEARPRGFRYGVQAHLTLVLIDLLRLAGPGPLDRAQTHDPMLGAAFEFIERGFAHPMTAQDVARAVGRSAAHLTTAMRVRTGLTTGEWIVERRMAEARRLLVGTGLDLGEIADRVGYSDIDALARAFRRTHRLSPAAWRSAHRGNPPYR